MRRFRWNVLGVTVGGLVFAASTAAVLPSSATAPVAAQERDSSRRYDPKELVERLDQNKNGMVEPDEMQGRSRYFLERIAPQMGLDLTKPIPNDKLMEAVKNAPPREGSSGGPPGGPGGPGGGPGSYGGPGSSGGPGGGPGGYSGQGGSSSSGGSSGGGSSSSGRREEKAPLVPGFGAPSNLPKPPGFDGALAMATAAASSAESRYDRRVVEYVDRMMRDYDKNKDNQLDADEMKAVQWTGDPKESDTNRDGKLSRLELLDRIAKKWGSTTGPSSSSSGRSGSGFGSSSGSSSSSSGTSAADEAAKVRRYAEGLLKQYDANKNGVLDKDEWTQVRTITPDTDANKDGAVTIEELTAKLSGFGQQGAGSSGGGSSSSSSSSGGDRDRDRDRGGFGGGGGPPGGFGGSRPGFGSSSGSSGSGSRDKNANDKNKSYRQKSPLERLPKGLPDWFARNDANADGQVSMAEFSTSWSESKAAEFAGYDLNGDGVVTPQECLKAAEKGKSGPSGSYGGSSGGGAFGSSSGSSGSSGGGSGGGFGFSRDRGGDRGSDRGGPGGGSSSSSGSGTGSSGSSSGSSGDRGSSGGSRFSGFSRGGDRPGGDRGGDRSSSDSSKGSSSSSSSSKSDDAKPAETKPDDAKSSEETKPAAEAKPAEESKSAGDAKPSDAT